MSAHDRTTPKEIKAWCMKTLYRNYSKLVPLGFTKRQVTLMFKAYKRGYNDALSG